MNHVWKFSYFGTETESDIENEKETRAYKLMEKLNNHEKISQEDKMWITVESHLSTCVKEQVCRNGWAYDFRPFMKRYVCRCYSQWEEVYAFSKHDVHKVYHSCSEIQELPNKLKEIR